MSRLASPVAGQQDSGISNEVFVSIAGRQMYQWRAVDDEGEVLHISRGKEAALRLTCMPLKRQVRLPMSILTDRYSAYDSALRDL